MHFDHRTRKRNTDTDTTQTTDTPRQEHIHTFIHAFLHSSGVRTRSAERTRQHTTSHKHARRRRPVSNVDPACATARLLLPSVCPWSLSRQHLRLARVSSQMASRFSSQVGGSMRADAMGLEGYAALIDDGQFFFQYVIITTCPLLRSRARACEHLRILLRQLAALTTGTILALGHPPAGKAGKLVG